MTRDYVRGSLVCAAMTGAVLWFGAHTGFLQVSLSLLF